MEVSLAGRRWAYDRAMHDLGKIVDKAERGVGNAKKNLERETARIQEIRREYGVACRINPRSRLAPELEAQQATIWQGNIAGGQQAIRSAASLHRAMLRQRVFLAESKPFILGPATIDSLMYWEPRDGEDESKDPRYDFIRDGKLPFPGMFFEFFDPVRFDLPFEQGEKEVLGMGLVDTLQLPARIKGDEFGLRYILSLYYQRDGKVDPGMTVAMNPERQQVFLGNSESTRFRINMENRVVEFDEHYDGLRQDYPHRRPLGDEDETNPFVKMARLATNIVNYVNAHNVYVRTGGQRRIHPPDEDVHAPPSRTKMSRPFYVVEVRDEVIDREPLAEAAYTLNCQFWVRGHSMRYRNPSGTIRYTTWRKWHKKGPDGAPWKEHRWAVSNDKIERERAMLKELRGE